jgi:hypothetical protein
MADLKPSVKPAKGRSKAHGKLTKAMRDSIEGVARSLIFKIDHHVPLVTARSLIDRGLIEVSGEKPLPEWSSLKSLSLYRLTPDGVLALGVFAPMLRDRLLMDEKDAQIHKQLEIVAPEIYRFLRNTPRWGHQTRFAAALREKQVLASGSMVLAGPFMNELNLQILDQDLNTAEALVSRLRSMKDEISLIKAEQVRLCEEAELAGDDLMVRALCATVDTWPKVHGNWGDGRWIG